MKAAIRKSIFGGVTLFSKTQPEPNFSPSKNSNEVLVNVKSAAINPVDYKLPRFVIGPVFGLDFSGIVEEIGDNVTNFKVGDAVYGHAHGSLAEKAVSSANKIAKKTDDLTFSEAAALPVAYVTALQGLRLGKVTEGSSVLIIGASGGCGIAAIQLAKAMGAKRIIAICSGKNSQLVKETGATEVVDYTNESELQSFFATNKEIIQCVYDAATGSGHGEKYTNASMSLLLKDVGEYVQLNGSAKVWTKGVVLKNLPKHQHLILTDMNTADLEEVSLLLKKINAKPLMNIMPFTEEGLEEGFDLLKSRRAKGKIVFDI